MTDNLIFRKAFRTCIELVRDRGFKIDENYNKLNDNEIDKLLYDNNLDIIAKKPTSDIIYVKFINIFRTKVSFIQEIVDKIYENNPNTSIIIVLKSKPSAVLRKLETKGDNNIQIFHIKHLQINPTNHSLVPIHIKLTENQVKELLNKYKIITKSQFPLLLQTDPIARYYNFKRGDVIKITSKHKNIYENIYHVTEKKLGEKELILEKTLIENDSIKRRKSLLGRRSELKKYFNENISTNILRYRYVK